MDLPNGLRVIGVLSQDAVVRQMAAHDPAGVPVVVTVAVTPVHMVEAQAFTRWAYRLTACSDHPHIADVCASGLTRACPYLAVRTGERLTLTEFLARSGPLPAEHVRMLGAGLADALATAHEAGLWHLAVSPDVIFIGEEDRPVLAGFDAGAPGLVRPMATGPFSAPEYRIPRGVLDSDGPSVGAPVDVYALAAVLYTALGGVLPWGTDPDPRLREQPVPDLPDVSPGLVDVLRRALVVHPVHRLTAAQLRAGLLSAPAGMGSGLSSKGRPGRSGETLPPPIAPVLPPLPPDPPDPSGAVPAGRAPSEIDRSADRALRPLVGEWRIATDAGEQELLVVRPEGGVTWTGLDDFGPFVATGEVLPMADGVFRLLLNEPAGALGLFVDLRLSDGGLSFEMDQAPGDGMVDQVVE